MLNEAVTLDPTTPDYRERFEARLKLEGNGWLLGRETFPQVVKTYRKLIKNDDYSIKQIYLHALSAYLHEPSNLQTLAPTSEGKTYPIVNVLRVFPGKDVWSLGGLSPTAIQHDKGHLVDKDTGEDLDDKLTDLYKRLDLAEDIEDTERRKATQRDIKRKIKGLTKNAIKEVNLEGKIVCFLDRPNPKTLDMLKHILSHDKYESIYKITDKKGKRGLESQTIKVKGWPCFLVASTKVSAFKDTWDEIVSRFDTISPNMTPEKYRAAVELTAQRKGLPNGILRKKLGLDEFDEVRKITAAIKDELMKIRDKNMIEGDFIPNIFWIPFYEKLGAELPAEVGRHMRDSTRFFTILQMHAAANIFNRPRLIVENKPAIIVTRRDYEDARELYFSGERGESLITGIPERCLKWYDDVFLSCWKDRLNSVVDEIKESPQNTLVPKKREIPLIWVTTGDLTDKTAEKWMKPLTTDHIRKNYLEELVKAGYIDAQDHPTDKRAKHYRPLIAENTRKYRNLDDSVIFSPLSLKEDLKQLKKIVDSDTSITIQDYDGYQITVEELYEKYFFKPDKNHEDSE